MPKRLRRLRIDEGSLVDKPANLGAKVVLWKRAEDEPDGNAQAILAAVMTSQSIEQFQAAIASLVPALAKGDTMPAKTEDLAKQLDELEEQIGALTKANADLTEQLKAEKKGDPAPEPSAAEAELTKKLAEAEAARKAAEDKLAKLAPPPEPEDEINLAELPAAVRRRIEDADNLRKTVEESKVQIEKLAAERTIERCATRIAKNWPSLPIKAEHFAPIFSKIEAVLKKDELKELENILTSHAEAMKIASSTLGREYVTSGNSAWDEIVAKAEALRKVDPKMTEAQSIDETVKRFPDLYKRYDEEKRQVQ